MYRQPWHQLRRRSCPRLSTQLPDMLTGPHWAAPTSPIRTGEAECTILIRVCLATNGGVLALSSCAGCARFRVSPMVFFAPGGAFGAKEAMLLLSTSICLVGLVATGVESEPYALEGVMLSTRAGVVPSLKLSLHSLDDVDSVRVLWVR